MVRKQTSLILDSDLSKAQAWEGSVSLDHGLETEGDNEAFEKEDRQRINTAHQAHPDDESAIWLWNRYTQNLQMQKGIGIIRTALWIVG